LAHFSPEGCIFANSTSNFSKKSSLREVVLKRAILCFLLSTSLINPYQPAMKRTATAKKQMSPSTNTRCFNRPFVAIALLACSAALVGCNNAATSSQSSTSEPASIPSSAPQSQADTTPASPVAQKPDPRLKPISSQKPPVAQKPSDPVTDLEPEMGIIREIQQGDLMCYITFTDESGKERTEGAIFELCEQPEQYLNRRYRLVYGVHNVNDCTSNEPCGKTRRANLIERLDPVDKTGSSSPGDVTVLTNGEWTITVGNGNSWSGVNGTGNLTYQGCNSKQQCLKLQGGKVTCRNGICSTVWRNGRYTYTLNSPITENPSDLPSTLIVAQDGKELQRIFDLK